MRVTRRTTVAEGFNTILGPWEVIASGIYVNLRPKIDGIAYGAAGAVLTAQYYGACWVNDDIQIGDLLADETENDSTGDPVMYQVEGSDSTFAFRELQLKRTQVPGVG
jgi:hypothetical protein